MPNNKISKTLEKCVVPRLRFHGSTSMAGKLADDIERLNQLVEAARGVCADCDWYILADLKAALRNIELESEDQMNKQPKTYDPLRATPAELAIRRAVAEVESMPAHPLLTDAVVLLGQARNKVADYIYTQK